jgi:hypothetical protein
MAFLAGWSLGVLISAGCALAIWGAKTVRQHFHGRTGALQDGGTGILPVTLLRASGD